MNHYTSQDITMAKRFLSHLSQDEESIFAFQIFNDRKKSESSVTPQVLCGTFDEFVDQFIRLQEQGAGIFVTINRTDGKGRKTENIIGVRALFVDLDGSPLGPVLSAPLSPHLIIESSPDRYHAYWIVEGVDREHFSLIQKQLIARYQADHKVHDLPRVMRLPGFLHQKQEPFLTKIIQESDEQPFSSQQFLDAFGITISSQPIPPIPSHKSAITNPVLEALEHRGMLIQKQSHPQGCWSIQCPWGQLHSQQDTGTKYYEPNTNGYSTHGFKCFHKHCELKTIYDLATFLEVDIHCSMDPIPLYRQIEAAQPFPMNALVLFLVLLHKRCIESSRRQTAYVPKAF